MRTLREIKEDMKKLGELMEEDLKSDTRTRLELEYRERCILDERDAKRKEEYEKEERKKRLKKKMRSRPRSGWF